jgi:hypothetical protein
LGSGTTGGLIFSTTDNGNLGERVRILNNGAVGIGTTTPSLLSGYIGLSVVNVGYTQLRVRSTSTSAGIEFTPSSGNNWEIQANNSNQWFVFDRSQETYRLLIDSIGNVGIGTTSPAYKLDVTGEIRQTGNNFWFSSARIAGDGSGNIDINYNNGSSPSFTWYNGGTSALARITSTGNMGIGTTSPAELLDIAASADNSAVAGPKVNFKKGAVNKAVIGIGGNYLGQSTNTNDLIFRNDDGNILFGFSGAEKMRITSGGYIGIGTSTTTSGLQIQTEGTNTTSGSFLFVRSTNASFGGGAIGVGYQFAAPVGNNYYPFRIRAGTTNAIFLVNSAGVVYAGDTTGAIAYGSHDPYYAFNQDTNTGMDWAAADTLTFKTGGSERMRIASNGSVGIGTTSPNYTLQVNGTFYVNSTTYMNGSLTVEDSFIIDGRLAGSFGTGSILMKSGNSSGTWNQFNIFYYKNSSIDRLGFVDGGSVEILTLKNGGNVGIGTTNPATKLEVYGVVRITESASGGILQMQAGSSALDFASTFYGGTYRPFTFTNGGSERMRIQSDGNVGIGTSSPSQLLEVAGSSPIIRVLATSGNSTLRLTDNGVRNWDLKVVDVSDYFEVGGTSATSLVVTGAGNVGIGTNSPAYKLEVASGTSGQQSLVNFRTADSTTANNAGIQIFATPSATATSREAVMALDADGANASGGDYFLIKKRGNSGTTDFEQYSNASMRFGTNFISRATYDMTIANDGNVGIGTTSPTYKLNVVTTAVSGRQTLTNIDKTAQNLITFTNPQYSVVSSMGLMLRVFPQSDSRQGAGILANGGTFNGDTDLDLFVSSGSLESTTFSALKINARGNVGIGTTTVSNTMSIGADGSIHYYEPGATNVLIKAKSGNSRALLEIHDSAGVVKSYFQSVYSTGVAYLGTISNHDLVLTTNGTERMRIATSGNIGIGTSSPSTRLHVYSNANQPILIQGTTAGTWMDFQSSTSNLLSIGADGTRGIGFYNRTTAADLMTISSAGNVGIGTTSPGAKLQVDVSSASGIRVNGTGGYANILSQGGHLEFYKDSTPTYAAAIGLSTPATALSNDIQFATYNGSSWSARMTIANGGNIGIGTSSPLERITFGSSDSIIARSSDTTFNSGYCSRILFNQGGTGYGYLGFYTYQGGTGGGERMRITESGNVGIGITVPGGKLHVVGSSYISASANTTNIKFEGGGGNGLAFGTIDATSTYASWIQSGYVLNFVLATYNLLLQPLGGNVGVGTTSPAYKLDVGGTARVGDTFLITTATTADARLEVGSGRSGNGNSYLDLIGDATYTDYGLRLIRYDTGANAGSRLEHKGTGQFQLFAAEAASVTISTTSTERMRITSAGDLLVGRTSGGLDNTSGVTISQSSIGMQTEGNAAQIIMNRTTSDGTIVEIRRNNIAVGTISVTTTATAYNTSSDYRLKESIKPLNSGLSRVNALKPSVYNWKSDGSNGEGFLAHELAEVVPLAVTGQKDAVNDDGSINPQSVDLSKVVPILVAAIQELTARIKILESR